MISFCAYYEPSGRIRFKSVLQRSVEPPSVDGLDVLVLEEDFDATVSVVVDGALIEGVVVDPQADLIAGVAARATRDQLLRASDWTQAGDSPLAAHKRAEWAAYRQALRDWPTRPEWPHGGCPPVPQG